MKSSSLLLLVVLISLAGARTFHVSPTGSDTSGNGASSRPFRTLSKAREAVRDVVSKDLSEDVQVQVAAGEYTLSEPLHLDAVDSGRNGFKVIWTGSDAVISGGLKINGWEEDSNGVYVASVPAGTHSRNLFVDGKAANYARRRIDDRDDFNYTATGMSWEDPAYDWLMTTPGIEDAEVRFVASFTDRYSPIASVGDRELIMRQNAWANQIVGYDTVVSPFYDAGVYVQNARALLTDGGEFYLDSKAGKVYYKPLDGESLGHVETYLGILEAILVIGGTHDDPAHDIVFDGFRFAHSTWTRPTRHGYVDQQTGGYIGENVTYPEFEASRPRWWQMPGAVQISAARNVEMRRCTYEQLGAGGIGIGNDDNAHWSGVGLGAANVSIEDGYFTQIMGGSILAGGIQADAHHPPDPRMINSGINISGNIFFNNSVLYSSNVNILTTYVQNSEISYNDIFTAPYSGISHGYGWGSNDAGGSPDYRKRGLYKYQPEYDTPTTSKNNIIKGNLIHSYGYTHTDLGGLYTLSRSPGTLFIDNYMYDSEYKGLHPDEGTSNVTYINNLCFNDALWYDPNQPSMDYRTGNNTLVENWGKNPHPTDPLDGYPNHTGPFNNTFLRNRIAESIDRTNLRGQRAAYRAGILPAQRAGRPTSNDPDLADGFLALERGEKDHLLVTVSNFDDVDYADVLVVVLADEEEPTPIEVPSTIPADGSATASYQLGSKAQVHVSASAGYFNPRTEMKRNLTISGTV